MTHWLNVWTFLHLTSTMRPECPCMKNVYKVHFKVCTRSKWDQIFYPKFAEMRNGECIQISHHHHKAFFRQCKEAPGKIVGFDIKDTINENESYFRTKVYSTGV